MTDTRPKLKKVVINNIDVSSYVISFVVTDEESKAVGGATIVLSKLVKNILLFSEKESCGWSVTIQRGATSPVEEWVFRGEIVKVDETATQYILDCSNKYYEAIRTEVTKYFDINISSEAGVISEIFKTILSETSLNYSDSTIQNTGDEYVLDKYVCNHASCFEKLSDLASKIFWQHYYDSETDSIYFEPKGFVEDTTITLEVGVNIIKAPKWVYDSSSLINSLTVKGAEVEVQTSIFKNGNNTLNQYVEFTYIPTSVKVYVGTGNFDPTGTGTKPSNNESNLRKGGKINSTSGSYDYEYDDDPEIRKLYFKKSTSTEPSFTPPTGTNNIEIQYTYKIPTPVAGEDSASIDLYGLHESTIVRSDIKTVDDAEVFLQKTLQTYSTPFVSTTINAINTSGLKVGRTYRIIDKYNNKDGKFRILRITKRYPYRYDEMIVGDRELREYQWQISTMDRLKRLEELQSTTDDLLLNVVNANILFQKQITQYVCETDYSPLALPYKDLKAEYLFENSLLDTSGNNQTATNFGAILTTDRFGNANSAYSFDGVNDYITVPQSSSLNSFADTDELTISGWWMLDETPTSWTALIGYPNTSANGFDIHYDGSKSLYYHLGINGTRTTIFVYNFPELVGNWSHITITTKSGISKLYINGVEKYSATRSTNLTVTPTSGGKLYINNGADYWKGKIDDVRIYNRALTAEEITLLYNEKAYDIKTGLIAYWKFDGNAKDSIGNNDGIVYGAKLTEGHTGILESAYSFDGVDDYVGIPDLSSYFSQNIGTISVWINHLSSQSGGRGVVMFSNSRPLIYLSWNKIQVLWAGATGFPVSNGYTNAYDVIGTNAWHHIVFTWDCVAGTYALYCDGSELESGSGVTLSALTTGVEELGRYSGSNYLDGKIDDIKIYNRALTSDEIHKLYEGGYNSRHIFILNHPQFGILDKQYLDDFTGIDEKLIETIQEK